MQESIPGSRTQKQKLHPGDIRYSDGGNDRDFRGNKIQEDTYGVRHQEKGDSLSTLTIIHYSSI